MKDYYKILNVDKKSTLEDIKKGFRRRALLLHPDKSGEKTENEFMELFEAYSILSDKNNRSRYDLIYDWIDTESPEVNQTELRNDVVEIQRKALVYTTDFKRFNKEVLNKIFLDLLLVLDRLVFATAVAVTVGVVTIFKGLVSLDLEYSFAGVVVTSIGLFFGKLKIDSIRYFEKKYRRIYKRG